MPHFFGLVCRIGRWCFSTIIYLNVPLRMREEFNYRPADMMRHCRPRWPGAAGRARRGYPLARLAQYNAGFYDGLFQSCPSSETLHCKAVGGLRPGPCEKFAWGKPPEEKQPAEVD